MMRIAKNSPRSRLIAKFLDCVCVCVSLFSCMLEGASVSLITEIIIEQEIYNRFGPHDELAVDFLNLTDDEIQNWPLGAILVVLGGY